jgi:hypothetical protein
MNIPKEKRIYWWVGTAVAFLGVAVTRLLAGQFAQDVQHYVKGTGVLLALSGLFIIMLGTRRRG